MTVGETEIEAELAAAGTGSDFDGNALDLIDVVDDLFAAGNGEVAEVAWGSVLDDIAPSWEAAAAEYVDKDVGSAAVVDVAVDVVAAVVAVAVAVAVAVVAAAAAAVAVQAAAAVVVQVAVPAHVDIGFPSTVAVGLAPPISSSSPPPIAAVVVFPARSAPGPIEPAASAAP